MDRYDKEAEITKKVSIFATKWTAVIHALFNTFMFGFNLWSYFLASVLVYNQFVNPATDEPYTIIEIVQVTQCTIMCMFTTGMVIPIVPAVLRGLQAGHRIFAVIERLSTISEDKNPITDIKLNKAIHFKECTFKYPKMPKDAQNILHGVSFDIKIGTSTAIVGPSGSGKSTIVQLISRFYDPNDGEICFDDQKLESLSLLSLRQTIGYVS